MKFSLVFDNSGDQIDFQTIYNEQILEYFINISERKGYNSFTDDGIVRNEVGKLLNEIHFSLSKSNEILYPLYDQLFSEHDDRLDYLDQKILNKQHESWVESQYHVIDIDELRFSTDKEKSRLGNQLHEAYDDDTRKILLAEAMCKLGYIFPYEEVNMTVHRIEKFFNSNIEFKSQAKWRVFRNIFEEEMISNNNFVNFSFGYTYVGRQYYDKWISFDTELEFKDHYNYEHLEWAFQINLGRPQTIPYSPEFIEWCKRKNVLPISEQIPVGNVIDLEKHLHYYRVMLYKNSRNGNRAKLIIN